MKDWTEFGLRPLPVMSARSRVVEVPPIQGLIDALYDECNAALEVPLRGITSDGKIVPGLFGVERSSIDTAPILDAALAFLQALDPADRATVMFPLDSTARRDWFNVHMNFFRHGVMLENLPTAQRELGLDMLRATLSARGFAQARNIMRLNEVLSQASGSHDEFGEWPYFITIFGNPSPDEPWGWQFDGHHLNVNCFVFGNEIVMTPTLMGSEPCKVTSGPFAGIEVFAPEQQVGIDLIRSLDSDQQDLAVIYESIMPGTLPPHLEHWIDGRMQAGAFKDNIVLPYQGIRADSLDDGSDGY